MTAYLKLTSLTLLLISITACTPPQSSRPIDTTGQVTQTDDTPLEAQDAEHYIALADQTTGQIRNQNLIIAAQILIEEQAYEQAMIQLRAIDTQITDVSDHINMNLLLAEIEINQGQSRQALKRLTPAPELTQQQHLKLMRLRAQAFLDAGYPFESAKTRVQLDLLLDDTLDKELNHQAIWEALSLLPQTSLQQASQAPLNQDFLGWIELARIAKNAQIDWQRLQDGIYTWSQQFPQHPAAATFIRDLGYKQIELIDQPEHIAVLLPLSGRYAQISAAIRDGIMTAYYQHPDKDLRPRISFIDTSNNQQAIWNYYRRAADMGADFIIGPFLKSAVDVLSRSQQMEIPTLTLNYASDAVRLSENLYQFGLLPEDEAQQSAEMAFRQGRTHAVILVPEGEWGERIRNAFQLRFEELGGKVISVQTYTPNSNDYKLPIQRMLNIRQSYARYQGVQNITGTHMKFIPYRRQDVDMIFMAATPKDARQLKPQFKFHYAGEIPVYATSHAFTGQVDSQADRDIDDLKFCDMPWILNKPNTFKQALLNHWPEQQRYTRFFAMGIDAYNLIPFIGRLKEKTYERFSGQTGNLYFDPFNRVHRELLWAQFNRGIPTLIDINDMPINFALDENQAGQDPIH